MDKNDGGAAFPTNTSNIDNAGACFAHDGMSLRDWFATHAPAVPGDFGWQSGETDEAQRLVRWNWHYADLMLSAREQ
jgi:hypothetical protein